MRRGTGFGSGSALVGMLAALAVACSRPQVPPPAAPVVSRPADALPADLDVVVRFDLARIRAALGPTLFAVVRGAVSTPGDAVVDSALEHADALWIGFRPGEDVQHSDAVVVLAGDFASVDVRKLAGFGPPSDLGAGWRRWDLAGKPAQRILPARLYARRSELLVAVSSAEIDAVERVVERGQHDPGPEAPEEGALSLAARLRAFRRLRAETPVLSTLLDGATAVTAHADVTADGLRATAAVEFVDGASAKRSAEALRQTAGRLAAADDVPGLLARGLGVEATGAALRVTLRLPEDALGRVLAVAAAP